MTVNEQKRVETASKQLQERLIKLLVNKQERLLNELNRVEMTDKREETTGKRVKQTSRGVETSTNDL